MVNRAFLIFLEQLPDASYGLLMHEVSRSQVTTHHIR